MPHVMFGGLVHEQALTLARRLAALLPGDLDRVFFSESGSVAVEIAMKMAQQYWINRGEPRKTRFVAFKGGYHGDTTGAMAVSDPDAGMHDVSPGCCRSMSSSNCPGDDERATRSSGAGRHAESIAGMIVEPLVQGAGGMLFHDAATLQRLRGAGGPVRRVADLRRNLHRLWPHRHDVRLRTGRRRRPTSSRYRRR